MRQLDACLLAAALLATSSLAASAQQSQPPHAWLFGTWTGGLFPAPSSMTAQACLATPVVIFTRDIVRRATRTEATYEQRVVETARTDPTGTEFRFAPAPVAAPTNPLLGMSDPAAQAGFGCESPNVLHVHRRSENEISFPGCADFPNPLVRCPTR
jgi:hypothetical protein